MTLEVTLKNVKRVNEIIGRMTMKEIQIAVKKSILHLTDEELNFYFDKAYKKVQEEHPEYKREL